MAAGITKKTLYRHFESKEALLLAIHEKFVQRVLQVEIDSNEPPDDQIARYIRTFVATVVSHLDEVRVFFEERRHLSPASLDRVTELRGRYEGGLRETLASGMTGGTFREYDVPLVSQAVLGAVANIYGWFRPGGKLSAPEIADGLAAMFLDGLVQAAAKITSDQDIASTEPVNHSAGDLLDFPTENLDAVDWDANPVLSRVLDVAAQLFYTQGYDSMSTRDLARGAGLTQSGLYYHIPNKESVLFQVNRRLARQAVRNAQSILANESDPVQALRNIIVTHCETVAHNLGALRALSSEMRLLDAPHHAEILALNQQYVRIFSLAVRSAVSGRVSPSASTDVLAVAIVGMLNFMHNWYIERSRMRATEIGETFFDLIWTGLLAQPATAPSRPAESSA